MTALPTPLVNRPASDGAKQAAQELANDMWAQLKPRRYSERMALIVLALKDKGIPTEHLRFVGGGGPDEWEWWEDDDYQGN